jgi:hypothetical protein
MAPEISEATVVRHVSMVRTVQKSWAIHRCGAELNPKHEPSTEYSMGAIDRDIRSNVVKSLQTLLEIFEIFHGSIVVLALMLWDNACSGVPLSTLILTEATDGAPVISTRRVGAYPWCSAVLAWCWCVSYSHSHSRHSHSHIHARTYTHTSTHEYVQQRQGGRVCGPVVDSVVPVFVLRKTAQSPPSAALVPE